MNKLLIILCLLSFASCTLQTNSDDVKLSHYTVPSTSSSASITVIFDQARLDKPNVTLQPTDYTLVASR